MTLAIRKCSDLRLGFDRVLSSIQILGEHRRLSLRNIQHKGEDWKLKSSSG